MLLKINLIVRTFSPINLTRNNDTAPEFRPL
jgi:hypothetical protein